MCTIYNTLQSIHKELGDMSAITTSLLMFAEMLKTTC